MGSDGHRKLLQREGVAYTLRYGPALVFTTPNIADANNGVATYLAKPWLFGPIAAAFGPVEALGRGSLHPHILVWLLLAVAAVASVQESSVTQLPHSMQPDSTTSNSSLVPPLPFGPNERRRYHADGKIETATAAELGIESENESDETKDAKKSRPTTSLRAPRRMRASQQPARTCR